VAASIISSQCDEHSSCFAIVATYLPQVESPSVVLHIGFSDGQHLFISVIG